MQKAFLMVLWLSVPQPMLLSRPLWLHLSGSDGVGAVMIPSFRTQAHISRLPGALTSFWHHCGIHLWESAEGNFLTRLLSPPGSGTLPFLVDFFPSFRYKTQQLWIPQCSVTPSSDSALDSSPTQGGLTRYGGFSLPCESNHVTLSKATHTVSFVDMTLPKASCSGSCSLRAVFFP